MSSETREIYMGVSKYLYWRITPLIPENKVIIFIGGNFMIIELKAIICKLISNISPNSTVIDFLFSIFGLLGIFIIFISIFMILIILILNIFDI